MTQVAVNGKPNRKQRRAHLQPAGRAKPPEVQLYEARRRGRSLDHLLATLCSAWWADLVSWGGAYLPNIKCGCNACLRRRQWPSHYVGSVGIAWECFLEKRRQELWDLEPEEPPRLDEEQARQLELHATSRRRMWSPGHGRPKRILATNTFKYIRVRLCENCGGDKAVSDKGRYCAVCEASVRKTLTEDDGWAQERIDKWVMGDDSVLEDE